MTTRLRWLLTFAVTASGGCYSGLGQTGPDFRDNDDDDSDSDSDSDSDDDDEHALLVAEVRDLAAGRGIESLEGPPFVRNKLFTLGRALAFDKELSGNRDISCMTCHLPSVGTGDARNLAIGQGGSGLGLDRTHPDSAFIPRNAPPLYNLHAMDSLFWDGRVSIAEDELSTPAGDAITSEMEAVFDFGAISALAMFPVLSREEMRGFGGNELAAFDDADMNGTWDAIMVRLGEIPQYRTMFEKAYPGTSFDDMTFAHASNAIGGYIVKTFAMTNTPWDAFLDGDDAALTLDQLRGAKNFLAARCSICHGGNALSDGDFHNVALAQFGPGVGNGPNGDDDFGRSNVSGSTSQRYAFRSTPLRNVELTAPYGHAGQFATLFDFIDHYSESDIKLHAYDVMQIEEIHRASLVDNFDDILDTRDPLLDGVVFPVQTIAEVTDFMAALTDPKATNLPGWAVPNQVPSGLSIDQ